jgi:uncharacterized protein (TIGR02266 family)
MTGSGLERRVEVRRVINREFGSVEEFITEYVSNISRSGAFIRSDDPLPVGTRVSLRFTVILDELEIVEGEGEVVRVIPPGGPEPSGMGVIFRSLAGLSGELIERILVRR